jgi:hypothetical protein
MAGANPTRFAGRRDAMKAQLSADQLRAAARRSDAWHTVGWDVLRPEWRALRQEIAEGDSPAALSCRIAFVCMAIDATPARPAPT